MQWSFKISGNLRATRRRDMSAELSLKRYRCENLKFCSVPIVYIIKNIYRLLLLLERLEQIRWPSAACYDTGNSIFVSVPFNNVVSCWDYSALAFNERIWSTSGMKMTTENWSTSRLTCPSSTSSTISPSRTDTVLNPHLHDERPATTWGMAQKRNKCIVVLFLWPWG